MICAFAPCSTCWGLNESGERIGQVVGVYSLDLVEKLAEA